MTTSIEINCLVFAQIKLLKYPILNLFCLVSWLATIIKILIHCGWLHYFFFPSLVYLMTTDGSCYDLSPGANLSRLNKSWFSVNFSLFIFSASFKKIDLRCNYFSVVLASNKIFSLKNSRKRIRFMWIINLIPNNTNKLTWK